MKRIRITECQLKSGLVFVAALIACAFILGMLTGKAHASEMFGKATFYTVASCQAEGTSGVWTASGEAYDESALTCAVRSREWGTKYRVTNLENGKSVIVRHNDYGPGRKPTARGVVIDLTPRAFDALGGKRGKTWGEMNVHVERMPE